MSDALAAIVLLAVMAAVVLLVGRPLWPSAITAAADQDALLRADLEAARAAKYREIRDAELDRATGKLSDEDWRAIDRRLRADAVEILHRLDALGAGRAAPAPAGAHGPGAADRPAGADRPGTGPGVGPTD